MLEELDLLVNLAREDASWLEARQALEAIPRKLAELEQRLVAVRRSASAAQAALEATRLERRKLEGQTQDSEAERRKLEGQLLQLKSNDAYRAMLHEIEGLKQRRSEIETRVLELMEREEHQIREVKAREAAVAADSEVLAAERRSLEQERAQRQGALGTLEAERRRILDRLSPAVRARYERLFASRPGHAVALVTRGSCGGCHTNLPPQVLAEVRRRDAVRLCEECGRLLVWVGE